MEIESDKEYHRKAIALLVCFFIAFMYVETVARPFYTPKNPAQPQTGSEIQPGAAGSQTGGQGVTGSAPAATTNPAQITNPAGIAGAPTQQAVQQSAYPQDGQLADRGFLVVKTKTLTARVSLLGGRLTELRLNDYRETIDPASNGLNLVHHGAQTPFPLGVYAGEASDVWTEYSSPVAAKPTDAAPNVRAETVIDLASPAGQTAQQVVLTGKLSDGREITKTLTFLNDGYFIDVQANVSATGADKAPVALEWVHFVPEHDTSLLDMYNTPGFVWFDGQKALRKTIKDFIALGQPSLDLGPVTWVAIGDKYFASTVISPIAPQPAQAIRLAGENLYRTRIQGDAAGGTFKIFAGPKSYKMLQSLDYELDRTIEFGTFGPVAAPLLSLLGTLFGIFKNYGLAIVVLTILVKLALYPLNSASYKQMKAMQDLKPEMDRIREQFKDKQEQQMQLMGLYKKHGVNPVGGCLPILLQMPVFIGLYSSLMLAVELRHAHFGLWIHDLSAPEKLMVGGMGIPVMVILFVISMVVQQATTPSQMDPVQKKMMMVMPLFLGFMFASFPSGLTLYWLTSNLISIGQQKGLQRVHNHGKKSGLQITLAVSAAVFVLAYVVTLL